MLQLYVRSFVRGTTRVEPTPHLEARAQWGNQATIGG
jgi:hypothetical protein